MAYSQARPGGKGAMKGAMAGAIAALGKGAAAPRLPHPPQGTPPPPAGKGA
eukprot:CAMPEP_0195102766 /NCGR_PEP_ID=MMETSP0448-20130528/69345_1 /TAXON_ID=66468 /ORGANISM="Heterocapsa triquestra, Strain CCMP 448" /LENGTH=50 /DNA_ID=CAMNT_0040138317 /DNA_START=50 /DNA_END=198 /DNA_ORIENTATION=-